MVIHHENAPERGYPRPIFPGARWTFLSSVARGADHRIEVELPAGFARYVASQGSVALNGVSLTVAEVLPASFAVWIIPHTRRQTNFESLQPNDIVNVEFDIIAKYVQRMLPQNPV